jgi:hypothetical protein
MAYKSSNRLCIKGLRCPVLAGLRADTSTRWSQMYMSACQLKQLSWECKMVLEAIINSLDYKSPNWLRIEGLACAKSRCICCKWIHGSIMQLHQLKHYNPRASSGFQSSIDCGNLNFSSLFESKTYRSTSHIDKLLETVLGTIADSQTRFYVQWFCVMWVYVWR